MKHYKNKFSPMPLNGIVVDASCVHSVGEVKSDGYFHGKVEWRMLDLRTREVIYASRVIRNGTINIAEFIAIADGLHYLHQNGDKATPVYSDSMIAISWTLKRRTNSKLPRNDKTRPLIDLMEHCRSWIQKTHPVNPVLKWRTDLWGEIPADYGRK